MIEKKIVLDAKNLVKSFSQGMSEIKVLRGLQIKVFQSESISITGASGAGKSTLLHLLGSLDVPDEGDIEILGNSLSHFNDETLSEFRAKHIGFVFQFHHLLSEFTALENVMLACLIKKDSREVAQQKAKALLSRVGLKERMHHFPSELSGGELQRVAIARALVNEPQILFADEPTGNLDSQNSQMIQDLFFELQRELGLTLIVVTHDPVFAKRFHRTLHIKDGLWSTV
jgi:lipoprotein-releasing system ATP-binding protein